MDFTLFYIHQYSDVVRQNLCITDIDKLELSLILKIIK